MNPTIDCDSRAWVSAANDLFKTSSRSCVDFINGQALRVTTFAIQYTEKANVQEVQHVLGQVGKVTKGKRTLRDDVGNTLAARILQKIFNEKGQWADRKGRAVKGKTLADKVRNFIARRSRSVAFIKSGWIPAVKKLASVVKKKPQTASVSAQGSRQIGKPKGRAVPAAFYLTRRIECIIENTIPAHVKGTGSIAEKGLRQALREAARDMIETLAKRLKQDLRQFGAK